MLGISCHCMAAHCATLGESTSPLRDSETYQHSVLPTTACPPPPSHPIVRQSCLVLHCTLAESQYIWCFFPTEDVYSCLQYSYSFYAPSVAARQLLSLSPTCKEMRRPVLDIGLPALAKQVRSDEQSVTKQEQAVCLMGTLLTNHMSCETLGFRVCHVIQGENKQLADVLAAAT